MSVIFREWKYVSMYALTCTLLLTYPTQTPLLFSGSRLVCLDRQWFLRFICAHGYSGGFGITIEFIPEHGPPHTLPLPLHHAFFNLLIYCRLYKGVQDPVSFTVRTGQVKCGQL